MNNSRSQREKNIDHKVWTSLMLHLGTQSPKNLRLLCCSLSCPCDGSPTMVSAQESRYPDPLEGSGDPCMENGVPLGTWNTNGPQACTQTKGDRETEIECDRDRERESETRGWSRVVLGSADGTAVWLARLSLGECKVPFVMIHVETKWRNVGVPWARVEGKAKRQETEGSNGNGGAHFHPQALQSALNMFAMSTASVHPQQFSSEQYHGTRQMGTEQCPK